MKLIDIYPLDCYFRWLLIGFVAWILLRGVWRAFTWAIVSLEPSLPPIVFGPWEMLGAAVWSLGLGYVITRIHKELKGDGS